jgi:hypothetical protein
MIVEAIISVFASLADWFLGLLGDAEPPAWITDISSTLLGFIAAGSGLGVWVPWAFMAVVTGVVLLVWSSGFLVKFVRWCIGLIPTMGGS